MRKKDAFLGAAMSAAILSFAGIAMAGQPNHMAQASQPGMESQQQPGSDAPAASPSAPESTSPGAAPGATEPAPPSGSGAAPGAAPEGAAPEGAALNIREGMDVVDTQDKKIGEVAGVEGDKVILSVGGFLGMGAREVALDRNQLTMAGTGDDAKLQTTMTQKEIEALPEHKPAASGGAPSPEGAGQPPEATPPATGGEAPTTR